jgi:hypothetical protein
MPFGLETALEGPIPISYFLNLLLLRKLKWNSSEGTIRSDAFVLLTMT